MTRFQKIILLLAFGVFALQAYTLWYVHNEFDRMWYLVINLGASQQNQAVDPDVNEIEQAETKFIRIAPDEKQMEPKFTRMAPDEMQALLQPGTSVAKLKTERIAPNAVARYDGKTIPLIKVIHNFTMGIWSGVTVNSLQYDEMNRVNVVNITPQN